MRTLIILSTVLASVCLVSCCEVSQGHRVKAGIKDL